jgi:glycosyltransferase involved in cell wall biosynthesis
VIEAWRWSTPVVATDRVALAPQIDGVGGLVAPYGDVSGAAKAIWRIVGDPRTASAFGRQGKHLVTSQFLLPDVIARTTDLYHELVAG